MVRSTVKFLFALAVALACGGTHSRAAEPAVVFQSCLIGEVEARCGRLEVPESRANPQGRRIALKVVVLPSIGPETGPPLFDLAGGPGLAATAIAADYTTFLSPYREGRAVVLVDQRGTGESNPLRCPELESRSPLETMYPADAVRRCRRDLEGRADLMRYGTRDAAADLEAVRMALGQPQFDVFALSYGTLLAQTYMEAYPGRVRAAVLIGAVPPDDKTPLHHARNAERLLTRVLQECEADSVCGERFPDLEARWREHLAAGVPGPVLEALRSTLVTPGGQRAAPARIAALLNGDDGPLRRAVSGPGGGGGLAEGLYLSVVCAESTRRITDAEIDEAVRGTFLGRYRVDEQRRACAEWPADPATEPSGGLDPGAAVLLLAGAHDHVTPPEWARAVAVGSPRARVIVVDALTHLPVDLSPPECLDQVILAFYRAGDTAGLDTGCLAAVRPPPFVLD